MKQRYHDQARIMDGEESAGTRYGGQTTVRMSLGQVAKQLGITRQAVQYAERSALRKLRLAFMEELKDFNPRLFAAMCESRRKQY